MSKEFSRELQTMLMLCETSPNGFCRFAYIIKGEDCDSKCKCCDAHKAYNNKRFIGKWLC